MRKRVRKEEGGGGREGRGGVAWVGLRYRPTGAAGAAAGYAGVAEAVGRWAGEGTAEDGVVRGATDAVLAACFDGGVNDAGRRARIEHVARQLGRAAPLDDDACAAMLEAARHVTDYREGVALALEAEARARAAGDANGQRREEVVTLGDDEEEEEEEEEEEIEVLSEESDGAWGLGVRAAAGDAIEEGEVPMVREEDVEGVDVEGMQRGDARGVLPEGRRKRRPREVDLEALAAGVARAAAAAAADGGRSVTLGQGSHRVAGDGWDEVVVPAPVRERAAEGEGEGEVEVEVGSMPAWARPSFAGVARLNRMQSAVYEQALFGDASLLLSAPTGAGKTLVAVLAILHEVGLAGPGGAAAMRKVVYVAPMKALAAEVVLSLSRRLGPLGVAVRELTGDSPRWSREEAAATQVVVATPEKWDVVTRKEHGAGGLLDGGGGTDGVPGLLILDEVHLLGDEGRGGVLEAVVARTLRRAEARARHVRLLGLSATLPNAGDVAAFLRVDPAQVYAFDASYRPVPLALGLVAVSERSALARHEAMNRACAHKARGAAQRGHQVLVFVHSRRDAAQTAAYVRDHPGASAASGPWPPVLVPGVHDASAEILREEAADASLDSADLRDLLPSGYAVHHAGLSRGDRALVEALFEDGHVRILVATATLAWGVNLPAHTVVVKGTQVYHPARGAWGPLGGADVLQMLGRAGRPGLDTSGEGCVITTSAELGRYANLVARGGPEVESRLLQALPDALSAEIALGDVESVVDGAEWLGHTFCFVRALRNPAAWGAEGEGDDDPGLEQWRRSLVHAALKRLDASGVVRYDADRGRVRPTVYGRVASHHYVGHASMARYLGGLRPWMGDIELLALVAGSPEFAALRVRPEEAVEVKRLLAAVPIPVREGDEEDDADDARSGAAKAAGLLQAHIGRLPLKGYALAADAAHVAQSGGRLLRCLFEVALARGWAAVAARLLALAKAVDRRCWPEAGTPARQFQGIPAGLLSRIEAISSNGGGGGDGDGRSFEELRAMDPLDLADALGQPAAVGRTLGPILRLVPRVTLRAQAQPVTASALAVELTVEADWTHDPKVHFGGGEIFHVWVEDGDSEVLLHHERILVSPAHEPVHAEFLLPLLDPPHHAYFIRASSDAWLGTDAVVPLDLSRLFPPAQEAPAKGIRRVRDETSAAAAAGRVEQGRGVDAAALVGRPLTAVEAACASSLVRGDVNVLVSAPVCDSTSRGLAEIALLSAVRGAAGGEGPDGRRLAVYVCASEAKAVARLRRWTSAAAFRGVRVVRLPPEVSAGVFRALRAPGVVVATAVEWELCTRKARKAVAEEVDVVVADDLHAVGGDVGPVLEVGLTRYLALAGLRARAGSRRRTSTTARRVVGLCYQTLGAEDLGLWLGAPVVATFDARDRASACDVRVVGLPQVSSRARAAATEGAVYRTAAAFAPAGGVIVFCPGGADDVEHAAARLVEGARAEGAPDLFCGGGGGGGFEVVEPESGHLGDGVAMVHEGMGTAARERALAAFQSGQCTALVVSGAGDGAAGLPCRAGTVVIAGAEEPGGRDVPLPSLLEMLARAEGEGGAPSRCLALCRAGRAAWLRRVLSSGDPVPVESRLDLALHEPLNAEVAARTVADPQGAVDWITRTYFYRRLLKNPTFYGLASREDLPNYLSDLVETTLEELADAGMVDLASSSSDDDDDNDKMATEEDGGRGPSVQPIGLGLVAAHHGVVPATVAVFSDALEGDAGFSFRKAHLPALLARAAEFAPLASALRGGAELAELRDLARELGMPDGPSGDDGPGVYAARVLLEARLARRDQHLGGALAGCLVARVLPALPRLCACLVDVASTLGHLRAALAAMEMSQSIVQGLAPGDLPLLQLPGVDSALAHRFADAAGVRTAYELLDMEDTARDAIFSAAGLGTGTLESLADAANRFPSLVVTLAGRRADALRSDGDTAALDVPSEAATLAVELVREQDTDGDGNAEGDGEGDGNAGSGGEGDGDAAPARLAVCPRWPGGGRQDAWWVVVGDPDTNRVLAIKRVVLPARGPRRVTLALIVPPEVARTLRDAAADDDDGLPTAGDTLGGTVTLLRLCLYVVNDSHLGADQELPFRLRLVHPVRP